MGLIRFRYGGQDYLVPRSKMSDPRIKNLFKRSYVYGIDRFIREPKPKRKIIRRLFLVPSRKKPETFKRRPKRFVRHRVVRRLGLSGVEIQQLRRIPERRGFFDMDVNAHIDKTLSYYENKRTLENIVGRNLFFNPSEAKRRMSMDWDIKEKENQLERKFKERKFEFAE